MKRLKKESLQSVLKSWSKNKTVLAPGRKSNGDILLDAYQEASFTLDYGKPSLPPKHVLFPQSDLIFRMEGGQYKQNLPKGKTVLFGLRACDLKGLIQSRGFMVPKQGAFKDIYFESRAKGLATVVMACPGPQNPTCFCTTTGSGPWADQGYDLQLIDAGDWYFVDAGSPAGEELASLPEFLEIEERERKKVLALRSKAAEKIPVIREVREAMDRLQAGAVPDEVWERFGAKCISCGGCSFVCPTCTCFNVYDRVFGEGTGERLRTWDTCLYGGFTKEASGHNPRNSQALRLKRRHEHKLLYYADRDTFGALSTCVGCGRCSDSCPVHIGAIEVAKAIAEGNPGRILEKTQLEGAHAYKK